MWPPSQKRGAALGAGALVGAPFGLLREDPLVLLEMDDSISRSGTQPGALMVRPLASIWKPIVVRDSAAACRTVVRLDRAG